jgi:hypothetical protein
MSKLIVKENKKLVLKQVIIHELRGVLLQDLDEEMQKFITKIQVLNVNSFGPLITKSHGTTIHDDGMITADYDIMLQAHDYKQYSKLYKIEDQVSCANSIYVRFAGHPKDLDFAYSKLALYFYENDLEDTGIMYNLTLENHPEYTVVDIFKPVVML